MNDRIIEEIDKHITELQKARAILAGSTDVLSSLTKGKRGRPKGSKNAAKVAPAKPKRVMSPEGKARIAEAQRKRHAAKKRADKKAAAEQAAA